MRRSYFAGFVQSILPLRVLGRLLLIRSDCQFNYVGFVISGIVTKTFTMEMKERIRGRDGGGLGEKDWVRVLRSECSLLRGRFTSK